MSKYTTSIEVIICSQSTPNPDIYARIDEGRKFLFDFNYQVPNADFKKSFETQFIEKYWTECIGYETVPLFKLKLKQRLEMLMPEVCFKYVALQKIIDLQEPNIERYGESHEEGLNHSTNKATSEVNSTANTVSSDTGKTVTSDLPASVINADSIGNVSYASGGNLAEGENQTDSSSLTEGESDSVNDANHSIERTFKEYGNQLKGFEEWYNSYNNIMAELLSSFNDMFIELLF